MTFCEAELRFLLLFLEKEDAHPVIFLISGNDNGFGAK
jgi:hypothetical protein